MTGRAVIVRVPGDKSITHRALICGALAAGGSRITGALDSADTRSTVHVLRALGIEITDPGPEVTVEGRGLQHLSPSHEILDCGNSGTTARLMLGVLAGHDFMSTLDGDASLRARPMRRVTEPLAAMGARFAGEAAPDRLPIAIEGGRLAPIEHVGPHASAQVKSALLLAGLTGGCPVTVVEPFRSRDHTERLLASLGVPIATSETAAGYRVRLEPVPALPPFDLAVPGDPSSAAFIIALGLLAPGLEITIPDVGVNPTRTGFLDAVARMGGVVHREPAPGIGAERVAHLTVGPARGLHGTTLGGDQVPAMIDEIPALAMLAARAEGETRIFGAQELRVKESDRIAALAGNLTGIGVEVDELPDGLVIRGTDAPLRGTVRAHGDHRIAMAFGILAALPGNRIRIDEPGAVDVSFPGFWQALAACTGQPIGP